MDNPATLMGNPTALMGSPAALLWGLLFGSLGMAYFVYGKKKGRGVPMVSGIAMMVFPYFVTNSILIVLIGIVLMAVPYFISY